MVHGLPASRDASEQVQEHERLILVRLFASALFTKAVRRRKLMGTILLIVIVMDARYRSKSVCNSAKTCVNYRIVTNTSYYDNFLAWLGTLGHRSSLFALLSRQPHPRWIFPAPFGSLALRIAPGFTLPSVPLFQSG